MNCIPMKEISKPHPSRSLPRCLAALSVAFTLVLAGCHSKTAPTPENFTATLNAYFPDHPDCLFPDAPRFPFETSDPVKTKQMDALVKAQLLTVAVEPSIHASRYTPTTTGARSAPRFCYGHRKVIDISNFTPPAQQNGFPETSVTYQYTMQDVPVWAKDDAVLVNFPDMAKRVMGPSTGTIVLAGTMAGWQVPN